jgi:hypothetical protein
MGGINDTYTQTSAFVTAQAMKPFGAPYTLVSLLALMVPADAKASADQPTSNDSRGSEQLNGPDRREIVVTANLAVIAALSDISSEQTYDSDRLASYAVNTVGEAVAEIGSKNGDEQPALLVNGQPVQNRNAIEDYPAEAIAHIDVLPRGSAQRIGGAPGQRAYNIVLRNQVTSVTASFGHKLATEGHWNEESGEVLQSQPACAFLRSAAGGGPRYRPATAGSAIRPDRQHHPGARIRGDRSGAQYIGGVSRQRRRRTG